MTVTAADAVALIDDLAQKHQRHGNMVIELPPIAALQLAGIILVALKHPDLPLSHLTIGSAIVAMIRGYFEDCPGVLALLDADPDAADEPDPSMHTRH